MDVRAPDPTRRSERARRAILDAALALCRDRGYDGTTIEAIAAEAGVGKQTIYRWWPSKGAVIMDALNEVGVTSAAFGDTDDVRADLRRQMTSVVRLLNDTQFAPIYRGVIAATQSDPVLAQALRERLIAPRFTACAERLRRAQQQGQLRPDVDVESLVEVLYGPLYYRLLLPGRRLDRALVDTVLDVVFDGAGITAGGPAARR
jgi:AcrR family transcriptional regulator